MTDPDPLGLVGMTLGGYNVERFMSSGAFAFVYAATQSTSGLPVALKILNPAAGALQILEFENEGSLLFKLSRSRGVIDIHESLDETQTVTTTSGIRLPLRLRFHVLARADGCLDELIADARALDWPSRLSLFRDVSLGVHQMHSAQVVHRDLKGANALLFLRANGGVRSVVCDLGRARDLQESASAIPVAYAVGRGDPNYAPPEFLWHLGRDNPITHVCADLYGLGSLLFELTTGFGISSVVLFPQLPLIVSDQSLPPDRREAVYSARLPEIRSWFQPAYDLFADASPGCIRPQAIALLRQLCDPDPNARLPQLRPGHRAARPNALAWLLTRADILRLTLANHDRQQRRLRERKGTRT